MQIHMEFPVSQVLFLVKVWVESVEERHDVWRPGFLSSQNGLHVDTVEAPERLVHLTHHPVVDVQGFSVVLQRFLEKLYAGSGESYHVV